MGLSDEDVREILRIIDESSLAELRIETESFSLYVRKDGSAAVDQRPTATPPEPAVGQGDELLTVKAPMLGTFYRAEAPGQPPFVEVGSRIDPDSTVCIIEVMKMMNSVPAGTTGTIAAVCAENGELVEYGEPLFRVRPA
jgi:acetyl-CoA carboxylase biotin carboxyl carrier protein